MIARLHTVAGQAQNIGNPHGGRTQNIALYGYAVLVAAGDLHDRGIAHAGKQGAYAYRRHMAIGAGGIDGIDAIHPPIEDFRPVIDILRIRAVRRIEFGRHGKFTATKDAFQASARRVTGQGLQRKINAGGVFIALRGPYGGHLEAPALAASRSAAACAVTRSQAEVSRSD